MGGVERQQLQFIRYGRPGAAGASLVVFGVYELVSPQRRIEWLLALLAVALLVWLLDLAALRRWRIGVVARVTLAVDLVLIAVFIVVLDVAALLVVPYFAPVAFAALLFGPLETVLYTVLGAVGGIVIGPLIGAGAPTILANILVLAVTGAILAALSHEARRAQAELTEVALAQAELVEQQQITLGLREELIANVSHELRTPLTSTIGFLQTLDRRDLELPPEQRRQFLAVARREAERLAVLVEDLLQLSRLERGELPLERTDVDLTSLVHRAVEGVEVSAPREIEVPDEDGVVVHVDPGRILQVLQNLLTNSIRHGEGRVRVTYEREPGSIRLLVTDDGAGVPEERVADLFVPFARTTARGDSTGLGLAISRRIAEAHGGSLVYRPPHDGQPHAFVMALPV